MKELEAGKEDGEKKSTGEKVAGVLDKGASGVEKSHKVIKKISEAKAKQGGNIVNAFANMVRVVDKGMEVQENKKEVARTEALQNDEAVKNDNASGRLAQHLHRNAQNKYDNSVIDFSENTVDLSASMATVLTGNSVAANAASKVVKGVMEGARAGINAKNDKETKKMSIKGIMGGVEGYKALKEKYKMKAPEMRYAMLEVLGLQSEQDIVNADIGNLATQVFNGDSEGARKVRGDAKQASELYKNGGGTERKIKRSHRKLSQKTEEAPQANDAPKEDVKEKPELQPA
jgi:hypothetical protein